MRPELKGVLEQYQQRLRTGVALPVADARNDALGLVPKMSAQTGIPQIYHVRLLEMQQRKQAIMVALEEDFARIDRHEALKNIPDHALWVSSDGGALRVLRRFSD